MSGDEHKNRHLTVVTRPRQVRDAYLIDPASTSIEMLDTLFSMCANVWGGRLFPIVPVIGGEISSGYWSLLRTIDPDWIYTYTNLPQALVDELVNELGPVSMERHSPHLTQGAHPHYLPSNHDRHVSVKRVLSFATEMRWFRKTHLLTCSAKEGGAPNPLIARNFGLLRDDHAGEPIPENIPQISFDLAKDLSAFLQQLAASREQVISPFAATTSRAVLDSGSQSHGTTYTIFIGDDIESWISFWNHIFTLGRGSRTDWRMLCLPAEELGKPATTDALVAFLRRFAYRGGNHPPYIEWTSASLTEDTLRSLAAPIEAKKLDAYHQYKQREPWSFPELPKRERYHFELGGGAIGSPEVLGTFAQQIPASGGLVNIPGLPFPTGPQEHWIQDVRIQYIAEYPYFGNEDLQYQLPRRREIARCFCYLPGRVDADGGLSFLIRRSDPLFVRIPEDRELILHSVGCGRRGAYTETIQHREVAPVYQDHGPSDKARYCRGVLNLFEGLQSAHQVFETRFWRKAFYEMAGLDGPESEKSSSMVFQKILKHPERWTIDPAVPKDEEIARIEKEITKLARLVRSRDGETTFEKLLRDLMRERAEFLQLNPQIASTLGHDPSVRAKEAEADLRRQLQEFANAKILIQGTIARCKHCGSRIWREISNLEQEFNCAGCGAKVQSSIESTWYYRLNTLVRSAIAEHGTVALIHALAQVREQARNSFIYSPGLEFYESYHDKTAAVEIDAICLVDGRVWIGEVKTNASAFKAQEIRKLLGEGRKMNADRIFVYASEGNQNALQSQCELLSRESAIPIVHLQPNPWSANPTFHI